MTCAQSDFNILNLETVVKTWAKTIFEVNHKKPKFEELFLTINWDRATFQQKPVQYNGLRALNEGAPSNSVLFKTNFANESDREQQYSFHVERSTTSVMEVQLQTGYSIGTKMEVSLKVPAEIFTMSAGFEYTYSLSRSQTQSKTESLSWGADSTISVPKGQRAVAELSVEEKQFSTSFEQETELSGEVEVVLTNPRDNNSFVTHMEGDIATMVKSQRHCIPKEVAHVKDRVVHLKTVGSTTFRFASEQKIRVSYEPL